MNRIPIHHADAMDGAPGFQVNEEPMTGVADYERDDMPAEIDFSIGVRGRYAKYFENGICLTAVLANEALNEDADETTV